MTVALALLPDRGVPVRPIVAAFLAGYEVGPLGLLPGGAVAASLAVDGRPVGLLLPKQPPPLLWAMRATLPDRVLIAGGRPCSPLLLAGLGQRSRLLVVRLLGEVPQPAPDGLEDAGCWAVQVSATGRPAQVADDLREASHGWGLTPVGGAVAG